MSFGPLEVEFDPSVLEPRPWTLLQSEWAIELAAALPDGPVLEMCSGAGQIGQVVALATGRDLVQVDSSPAACSYATSNARRNGLESQVEVYCAEIRGAADPDLGAGAFPLVLADPPYLPTSECQEFPLDPIGAIDGGPDGLRIVASMIASISRHLSPEGVALLQLWGRSQVLQVDRLDLQDLEIDDIRAHDPRRAVALLRRK